MSRPGVNRGFVRVLSTGAPKDGVSGCAGAWEADTGIRVAVTFVTAPVLRERIAAGTAEADVIVAPAAVLEGLDEAGHVAAGIRTVIGSVRAGVVVRAGARLPDISTVDNLKAEILAADSVIYNVATSGQFIARMMERLGVAESIAHKTIRVSNGAAVMERLAAGTGADEIGFGQMTEIARFARQGRVALVGPLPPGLENVTTYAAGVFAGAEAPVAAQSLVAFMGGEAGREICVESGLSF